MMNGYNRKLTSHGSALIRTKTLQQSWTFQLRDSLRRLFLRNLFFLIDRNIDPELHRGIVC